MPTDLEVDPNGGGLVAVASVTFSFPFTSASLWALEVLRGGLAGLLQGLLPICTLSCNLGGSWQLAEEAAVHGR